MAYSRTESIDFVYVGGPDLQLSRGSNGVFVGTICISSTLARVLHTFFLFSFPLFHQHPSAFVPTRHLEEKVLDEGPSRLAKFVSYFYRIRTSAYDALQH